MANHKHIIVAHAYDKKGKLLSCATNSYTKTHPLQAYFAQQVNEPLREFLHAEIACIIRCKDKQIHTLKIWRYGYNGKLLCAKPCAICQEAIKAYNIPNVWYSNHNELWKL
jgi:tRNA(Arg) A34 adenosine deaminase TadA